MAIPIRKIGEDHREHVRRVAGPRREQPRPGDLVAERRQAGQERDAERQARRGRSVRVAAVADGRGSVPRAPSVAGTRVGSARSSAAPAVAAARARARRARRSSEQPAPTRKRARQAEELDQDQARGRASRRSPRSCSRRTAGRRPCSARSIGARCRVRLGNVAPIRIVAGASASDGEHEPERARGAAGDPSSDGVDPPVDLVDQPERDRA